MFKSLRNLLQLQRYSADAIIQGNVRNTLFIAMMTALAAITFLIVDSVFGIINEEAATLAAVAGLVMAFASVLLIRVGRPVLASFSLILPIYIGGIYQILYFQFDYSTANLLLLGTLIAVATTDIRGIVSTNIANLIMLLVGAVQLSDFGQQFLVSLTLFFYVAIFSLVITRSLRSVIYNIASARRSQLLETSGLVVRSVFARRDLENLLTDTVETIRTRFDNVYHAQVFLVDETRRTAVLRASTGEVGKRLMEIGHALPVGSQSVIGRVTQRGIFVLAEDTSQDPVHRRNELLPNTRTELALPLRVAEGVIGALDLQSLYPNAFSPEDIEVLQALADQIALAIENARLLTSFQRQINENRQLLEREVQNRREIEDLNSELLGTGWRTYLQISQPVPNQLVNIDTGDVIPIDGPSALAQQALATRHLQLQIHEDTGIQNLVLPILVGNSIIAVMEFEIPTGQVLPDGILASLNTLSESLGVVFENSRLYNQARTIASREQVVGNVATQLLQYRDVNSLVSQAAPLFNAILTAEGTQIRLGQPDVSQDGLTTPNGQRAL
jgi:GAF domain-containing protein